MRACRAAIDWLSIVFALGYRLAFHSASDSYCAVSLCVVCGVCGDMMCVVCVVT